MEPNQQNQGNPPSKSLFAGASGSLFTNNNTGTNNEQNKTDNKPGLGFGGTLFSPHSSSSIFGQPASGGLFGGTTPNTGGLFGQPTNQSKSIFPTPTNLADFPVGNKSDSIFGGFPKKQQASESKSSSDRQNPLFGVPSSSSSGGLFGQKQPGKSIFGDGPINPISSIFGSKPAEPKKQQAPKPDQQKAAEPVKQSPASIFPSASTSQSPLFGSGPSIFGNKISTPASPSAAAPKLSGSLFAKTEQTPQFKATQIKPASEQKNPLSLGSIFSNQTLPKKQDQPKPEQPPKQMPKINLFGKLVAQDSLKPGKPTSNLFSVSPQYKQKQTPPSVLFGRDTQSQASNSVQPSSVSGSAVASSSPAPATTPLFGSLFSNNNNINTLNNNNNNNSSSSNTIKPLDSLSNKSVQGSVVAASEKNATATNNSNNFNNQLFGAGQNINKQEPVVQVSTPSFNRERSGALLAETVQQKKLEQPSKDVQGKGQSSQELVPPEKLAPAGDLFKSQKIDFSRPPMPPKSSTPFKPTFEKNVQVANQKPSVQSTQKKDTPARRQRLPTFQSKDPSKPSLFSSPLSAVPQPVPKQTLQNVRIFSLHQLLEFLSTASEDQLIANVIKIEATFRRYLSFYPNPPSTVAAITDYKLQQFVPTILATEGANKFLNDFTILICMIYRIPPNSFRLFGDLFTSMLKQYNIYRKLFHQQKLNQVYFMNSLMYKATNDNNGLIQLQYQQPQTIDLLCQFVRYFSMIVVQCLKKIQNNVKIFKKSTIYELFLEITLLVNLRIPKIQAYQLVQTMKSSDLRLVNHLNKILTNMIESKYFTDTKMEIIDKQCLLKLIPTVDQLPISASTKIFQKILLRYFNNQKSQSIGKNQKQLITALEKTNSKTLLPFRVILHRLDKTKKKIDPFQKQLFEQIDGPEWADWLSLYLGQDNIRLKQKQMHYLIKSLKAMRITDIDRIITKDSQINRLIHIMRQQNQIKNFYEILSTLVTSQCSIQKLQSQYFKQDRSLNDDLRFLADELRRYPNSDYNQQDLPELHAKAIYFLTTLAISPQRAFNYQNALFDVLGFMDLESQRCDRVCHLVIDLFGYFWQSGQDITVFDDIVEKVFQAIVSLMDNSATKQYMNLAMNINRPQFQLFSKSLPSTTLSKISTFLLHILSSQQFYNSTRAPDHSILLAKSYPFRYSIQKYLSIVQPVQSAIQHTIPLYWFSNCIKIVTRNCYNPQLIQAMLSKLKVWPTSKIASSSNSMENAKFMSNVPQRSHHLITAIVETCNNTNFWPQLQKKLQAQVYQMHGKFWIANRLLNDHYDFSTVVSVFYSLNLLKTMLQLHKILNVSIKSCPKHPITQSLSSLHCLSQLDRSYIQSASLQNSLNVPASTLLSSIPPIISLLSLLCQPTSYTSSPILNASATVKTQWIYNRYQDIQLDNVKKMHNTTADHLDYSVIRDLLLHPHDGELMWGENIGSLASWCLNNILNEYKAVSVQGTLYMCIPKYNNKNDGNAEHFGSLRNDVVKCYVKALNAGGSLSRNTWKLLVTMRTNSLNTKLAQQIFRQYMKTSTLQSLISSSSQSGITPQSSNLNPQSASLVYICQYLLLQVKQAPSSNTYSQLILQLLDTLRPCSPVPPTLQLSQIITQYINVSKYSQSLHQFQRQIKQRRILQICHHYQIFILLFQIVTREMYSKLSTFSRHTYGLLQLAIQYRIYGLFTWHNTTNYDTTNNRDNDIDTQICDINIARLYGPDILQMFMSSTILTREDLVQIQVDNVINFAHAKLRSVIKHSTTFLNTILSLNTTLYQNTQLSLQHLHPSSTSSLQQQSNPSSSSTNLLYRSPSTIISNSPSFCQLFCQYHLGVFPYKSIDILGLNYTRAINNCKALLNVILNKVGKLKIMQHRNTNNNYNNNNGLYQDNQMRDIVQAYGVINMLINWLRANTANLTNNSSVNKMDYKQQLKYYCKQVLRTCFTSILGQPISQPYTAKLLTCILNILCPTNQLPTDTVLQIKQSIMKTISTSSSYLTSQYSKNNVAEDIRQEIFCLLLLLPPTPSQTAVIQTVANIWVNQDNLQYFFSQCTVIYKLASMYPLQLSKWKILTKNQRISRLQTSTLQSTRYYTTMRSNQSKCWLWVLKIATALMQNGGTSTLVVNQVSKFMQQVGAKRIMYCFGQFKQQTGVKDRSKDRDGKANGKNRDLIIKLTLAQLQQLQASLELFIVLSQSKMWVQMNRQFFEQCLYYLLHRTIILFAPGSLSQRLHKRYIPQSSNQKLMWRLQSLQMPSNVSHSSAKHSNSIFEGYDPDRAAQEQQYAQERLSQAIDYNLVKPNIFILLMSLKFNACLKAWLLACSNGMRMSCFVREYFTKSIQATYSAGLNSQNTNDRNRNGILRYSLTHWDHLNKAITQIIQSLTNRIRDWGKWQDKKQLLNLLNDSINSAQFFTESGYTSTLMSLPENSEQLIAQLGQSLSLTFQLGACHLVSQISFRNINGTFSKESLQGFQQKLIRLCKLSQEKLIQNLKDKSQPVFDDIKYGRSLLLSIKYD